MLEIPQHINKYIDLHKQRHLNDLKYSSKGIRYHKKDGKILASNSIEFLREYIKDINKYLNWGTAKFIDAVNEESMMRLSLVDKNSGIWRLLDHDYNLDLLVSFHDRKINVVYAISAPMIHRCFLPKPETFTFLCIALLLYVQFRFTEIMNNYFVKT